MSMSTMMAVVCSALFLVADSSLIHASELPADTVLLPGYLLRMAEGEIAPIADKNDQSYETFTIASLPANIAAEDLTGDGILDVMIAHPLDEEKSGYLFQIWHGMGRTARGYPLYAFQPIMPDEEIAIHAKLSHFFEVK